MNYRQFNDFCRSLPATTHVVQWGGAHVWKVGGKVFAIGGWEDRAYPGITFKVTPLSYDLLKSQPGLRPAPYLIALATASKSGSVLTVMGNPQNMLMRIRGGFTFPASKFPQQA